MTTEKKAYIVSFCSDEGGVWCTNIAMAEAREDVEAAYGDCFKAHVEEAKPYRVEELRRRGCPVVECEPVEARTMQVTMERTSSGEWHETTESVKARIEQVAGFDGVTPMEGDSSHGVFTRVWFTWCGLGYFIDFDADKVGRASQWDEDAA